MRRGDLIPKDDSAAVATVKDVAVQTMSPHHVQEAARNRLTAASSHFIVWSADLEAPSGHPSHRELLQCQWQAFVALMAAKSDHSLYSLWFGYALHVNI